MSTALTPVRVADDVFEMKAASAEAAQALADRVRELGFAKEVVAGLSSVSVRFDPILAAKVQARLEALPMIPESSSTDLEDLEIAIHYGGKYGPDLERICSDLALTENDFIDLHTSRAHKVDMIGFTPGFCYISGLPDGFKIPRLDTPRPRVPAGSVGISSTYTGLYAMPGPGGWPLIGRTEQTLFDASSDKPFKVRPRQTVRFRAV